eukprot:TRINITY_DN5217_c1_g2_i1.p1 TRINITY_DN5217_c1_g2~~TRINITY_DN5217_c1_g2_i1.p1  ORF type:complete len:490 (+),score=120.21 TRINITY_DN5217_c1_g2_i1:94-1563(+)
MTLRSDSEIYDVPTQRFGDEDKKRSLSGEKEAWGLLMSTNQSISPHLDLVESEITIGRQKKCTLVLDVLTVSGVHLKITIDNSKSIVFLEDLSSNGTFLNGDRLKLRTSTVISDGDIISLVAKIGDQNCVVGYKFRSFIKDDQLSSNEMEEVSKIYDVRSIIGTGNFSVVRLGVHRKTGTKIAIKSIDKHRCIKLRLDPKQVQREVNILSKLNHEHIVKIHQVFQSDKFIHLILDHASGGDLFEHIMKNPYSEDQARNLFTQILEAVKYLHDKGISHRDLKPENVLLSDEVSNVIKLTDFGLARIVGDTEMMKTTCGTPQYVAPEVLSKSESTGYSKQVDVWSLGVLLYVMLSGSPAFDEHRGTPLFEQILSGSVEFPEEDWADVSKEAQKFIKKMLTVDPSKRISIDEALKNSWVTGESDGEFSQGSQLSSVKNNMMKNMQQISSNHSPSKRENQNPWRTRLRSSNSQDESSQEDNFEHPAKRTRNRI